MRRNVRTNSKRNKTKENSGSRIRSRERIENKTLECNSAINTYQNSICRKEQSPLSFYTKLGGVDDDDNLLQYMQDSIMLNGQLTNIEKGLKKKVKLLRSKEQRPRTDLNSDHSTRLETEYDEEKLQLFIKSISEIAELHPS